MSTLKQQLNRVRDSGGFTLIELLIVVVIIGILAAIAIPQFASTKDSAYRAALKSDLRNAVTTMEAEFANVGFSYTPITQGNLAVSDGIVIEELITEGGGYCVQMAHNALDGESWGIYAGTGDDNFTFLGDGNENEGVPLEGTCA